MDIKADILLKRAISVLLSALLAVSALPLVNHHAFEASAASVTATGKISDDDVNLRKSPTTGSASIAVLKKNKKLTINKEVFTAKSTSSSKRWYYVTAGKKTGYVRADLVKDIKYPATDAVTTDALNYRKGPSTVFKVLGTTDVGAPVSLQLPASYSNSSVQWYRAVVGNKTAYICADYVKPGKSLFITKTEEQLAGKSQLARDLLTSPAYGGKARVVSTFNTSNCQKLFAIKGYKKAKVPQGFTFTGDKYYILYGMAAGQSIVTYSADGKRLSASKFSFGIGHPNGITYSPATNICYIFKGNQKRIYTWNPAKNKFGKSKTPYSSSGAGYDNTSKFIYASSRTGIRIYSADGKFTHQRLFPRCNHGIFHYTQDCGAGEGFIFHCISGANKKTTNYVDIYRAEDNAYLGSISVKLGEIESAVVGSDGYLNLLINTMGSNTDYIWKTPLNVNELK